MAKSKAKITRVDGVTQNYTVGTDKPAPTAAPFIPTQFISKDSLVNGDDALAAVAARFQAQKDGYPTSEELRDKIDVEEFSNDFDSKDYELYVDHAKVGADDLSATVTWDEAEEAYAASIQWREPRADFEKNSWNGEYKNVSATIDYFDDPQVAVEAMKDVLADRVPSEQKFRAGAVLNADAVETAKANGYTLTKGELLRNNLSTGIDNGYPFVEYRSTQTETNGQRVRGLSGYLSMPEEGKYRAVVRWADTDRTKPVVQHFEKQADAVAFIEGYLTKAPTADLGESPAFPQ
jgi:hypothetical protein